MKKYITILFLITQIFAFAGVGVYGSLDMFSTTPEASTDANTGITEETQSLDSGISGGWFVYIDFLPIIDLELSVEGGGNIYDANITSSTINTVLPEIPWTRISGYFTIRKKLIGASIPFLAKVQVYAGAGPNMHWTSPTVTTDLLLDAFSGQTLEQISNLDFTDNEDVENENVDLLIDYAAENMIETTGIHLQLGAQAKVLIANMFINARYTIAKDVVPGTSGFPSLWVGFAVGL